jgi:hypothetical protein
MKVKLKPHVARPWFVRGVMLVPTADYVEMPDEWFDDVKANPEMEVLRAAEVVEPEAPKRGRKAKQETEQADTADTDDQE